MWHTWAYDNDVVPGEYGKHQASVFFDYCEMSCGIGNCDHFDFVHSENCDRIGFRESFWKFYQSGLHRPDVREVLQKTYAW